ncbi:DNA helicase [Bacteroidia bacterium]|nr:DNA helicase [Bacteroidia bacterium]
METTTSLRIIFREINGEKFLAETPDNQPVTVVCNESQQQELDELSPVLQPGNVFNLLNVNEISPKIFTAEFLVFEPDYLVDISALAECFRPYGSHFLNYTLSRLQDKETTPAILLGNTANFFIDELINEDTNRPAEYQSAIKKMFKTAAFEFTACEALKDHKAEIEFFAGTQKHFENIRYAVQQFFPKTGINKEKAVLEPSFVCNALGLQGRLDLMLSDYSAFIELKSGKAVEDFRTGGQFVHSAENHYTQMILYLAVLEFNLDLSAETVRSYLLYSKYPVMSRESHSRKQLRKALHLRNQITAWESALHTANDISITDELLGKINSKNLNTEHLSGKFFDKYLAPSIDRFAITFSGLNEKEKAYFLRIYTFILKELWLSKAGEREYEGLKKASVLWNAPFEDKRIAGELLYDLKITDNRAAEEDHTIRLEIPQYENLYLPNFRPGDAVVLYERNSATDTVNNRQVFKGAIELMEGNVLIIRLRYRQKNPLVWNPEALYAVEHDYMDTTFTGMFRALASFLHANQDRKDLLLGERYKAKGEKPFFHLSPFASYPVFLLIGPPGTGKTSIALKQMVETELQKNKTNILLLAYTNRAVDEICKALSDISQSLPYIRIGSELNCAPEFRTHLLENGLEKCNNRRDVEEVIRRCRIFVGTAASVWNKPELFSLKHFDIAIIDEATQLLEPHLLGIFCARNVSGENAVGRFVLIGDHKQLPAVVLQSKEESRVNELILNTIGLTDLSNSLFERFYHQYSEEGIISAFDMLTCQGRMHPAIAAFPSEHFYDGRLESAGLPHQIEEWAHHKRLHFYSIKPLENEFSDKANLNEALRVVEICQAFYCKCLDAGTVFNPDAIGIITPYRSQIALIRKKLQETEITEFAGITVDTVERFQGSQRDTIIYSFCVKTENQLAALPNWMEENGKRIDRKLNVALTRARKELFVIGNAELLCKNEIYGKLIEFIEQI